MLKLIEVYSPPAGPDNARELLASLDVTENTEPERLAVVEAVKVLYPECSYYWHDCGHVIGGPCAQEEVR